jgi:hypothetical protein
LKTASIVDWPRIESVEVKERGTGGQDADRRTETIDCGLVFPLDQRARIASSEGKGPCINAHDAAAVPRTMPILALPI